MQTYKKIIFVTLFLCLTNLKIVYAEDVTDKLKNLWDKVSDNSEEIIEWSLDSFSNFTEEVGQAVDAELEYFTSNKTDDNPIELQDKIDSLKIYVEKITDLKEEEEDASSFTLIGKSKKDYRIKIDEVLSEIEIILFDGEVVNYAEKIRKVREQIISLETRKVILNEDLVFASHKLSKVVQLNEK